MKSRLSPNLHAHRAGLRCVLLACAVTACSATREGPNVSDTTTNWLHACERSTDCRGESSCIAGTCTIACSPGAESACASVAPNAECVEPKDAPAHCDLPCSFDRACDDLGNGYACNQGACRPQSEITRQESGREPGLDASKPETVASSPPPPTFDAGFDASVPFEIFDGKVDSGMPTDSGFYYPFAGNGDAGPACPIENPPVTWQPPAWEPFTTDAGSDERFKIVQESMVGRWRGLATPGLWPKPYLVELEFRADGTYGGHCTEIPYPCCRALNGGADEEHPLKQYRLLDALASGYVIGELDMIYIFDSMASPSGPPRKLSYIERDRSGNGLRLQLRNPDESGMIKFDLRRVPSP